MIKELLLHNYRSYLRETRVPLGKITLLFGPNSSGKSSIVSVLSLLRQTLENPNPLNALVFREPKGLVDLGRFQDVVSDGNSDRSLTIGITGSFSGDRWRASTTRDLVSPSKGVRGWERSLFGRRPPVYGVKASFGHDQDTGAAIVNEVEYFFDQRREPFVRLEATQNDAVQLVDLGESTELWRGEFDMYRGVYGFADGPSPDQQWRNAVGKRFGITSGVSGRTTKKDLEELKPDSPAAKYYALGEEMLSAISSDDYLKYAAAKVARWQWELFERSHFLIGDWLGVDEVWDARFGGHFEADLAKAIGLQASVDVFSIPAAIESASEKLRGLLSSVLPLGPLRELPRRVYESAGIKHEGVGVRGQYVAEYLAQNPEEIEEANEWLQKMETGHSVMPRYSADRRGVTLDLFDLSRSTEVSVSLADVGFGISQALPILVQCLASRGKVITIEQPEVHVHPRLQANMADLFIEATRRDNQCIVETHSEHLVLRLLKRIREGVLDADDVQILYINRGDEGSKIIPIDISSEGELLSEWPGGFFEERLDELF